MKIKVNVISRNPEEHLRVTNDQINIVKRSFDKKQHPFQAEREYIRALNAAKLEKIFAKPYISCLEGHSDGICFMDRNPKIIKEIISGSVDGEIRIWDLMTNSTLYYAKNAHLGAIKGVCYHPKGDIVLSAGTDNIIKVWKKEEMKKRSFQMSIASPTIISSLDYSQMDSTYASCGDGVHIYDINHQSPVHHLAYGSDSLKTLKFNKIEENIIATASFDRSLILFDVRQSTAISKVTLSMRTNSISWNPQEAYYFVTASEDTNLYAFDMRNLSEPFRTYSDHVNAVMDVDFSPSGLEFVSASYDKTLRIFQFLPNGTSGAITNINASDTKVSTSRDVYHTKRMQRLFCVRFSGDAEYVLTGSDEMNIRIWKAQASKKLGPLRPREKKAINYAEKLKERFQFHPQVKKIKKRRHLPSLLYSSVQIQKTFMLSRKRKDENIRVFRKEKPHKPKVVIATDQDPDN